MDVEIARSRDRMNSIEIVSSKAGVGTAGVQYTVEDIVNDGHCLTVRVSLPATAMYGDVVRVSHTAWWVENQAEGGAAREPTWFRVVDWSDLGRGYVTVSISMEHTNSVAGIPVGTQADATGATLVLAGDRSGVAKVTATILRYRESFDYLSEIGALRGEGGAQTLSQYEQELVGSEVANGVSYADSALTMGIVEDTGLFDFWDREVVWSGQREFGCSATWQSNILTDGVTAGLCHITYVRGAGQTYGPYPNVGSPSKWRLKTGEFAKFVVQLAEPVVRSVLIAEASAATSEQFQSNWTPLTMTVDLTVNKHIGGTIVDTRTITCFLGMNNPSLMSGAAVLGSSLTGNDTQTLASDITWFTGDPLVTYSFSVDSLPVVMGTQVNLQFTDMSYPGIVRNTLWNGFTDVPDSASSYYDAGYNPTSYLGVRKSLTATLMGDVQPYGLNKFGVGDNANSVTIRVNCQSLGVEFSGATATIKVDVFGDGVPASATIRSSSSDVWTKTAFHTQSTQPVWNTSTKLHRVAVPPGAATPLVIKHVITASNISDGYFDFVAVKNGQNSVLFDMLRSGVSVDFILRALNVELSNSFNSWIDTPTAQIMNGRSVFETKVALVSLLATRLNVGYDPVVGDSGVETFDETSTSLSTAPVLPKPVISIDSNKKKITIDYTTLNRFTHNVLPAKAGVERNAVIEQAIRLNGRASKLWAPTRYTHPDFEYLTFGAELGSIADKAISNMHFVPGFKLTETYKSGVYPESNIAVFPLNIQVGSSNNNMNYAGWGWQLDENGLAQVALEDASVNFNSFDNGYYMKYFNNVSLDRTSDELGFFAAKYTRNTVEFDYTDNSGNDNLIVELSELLHQQFMPSRVGVTDDSLSGILTNAKVEEVQWGGFLYQQPITSKHVKLTLQSLTDTVSIAATVGGAEILVNEDTNDNIGKTYLINNPFHATVFLKPAFNVKLIATTSAEPNGVVYIKPGSSATVKKTAINTYEVLVSGASSSDGSTGVDISGTVQGVVADIASIETAVNGLVSSASTTATVVNSQSSALTAVATLLDSTKTSVDEVATQLASDAATLTAVTQSFNTLNTNIYNNNNALTNLNYSVNITNTNLTTVSNALTSIGNSIGGIVASTIPSGTVRWVAGNFSDPAWEDLRIQPPTTVNPTAVAVYGMPTTGGTLTRTNASVYSTIPIGGSRIVFAPTVIPGVTVNPCEMDYSSGVAITSYPNTGNPLASNISYVVAGDYLYRIGGTAAGGYLYLFSTMAMAKSQISVSGATNMTARTWVAMTAPTRGHSGGAHVVLGNADTHCILFGGINTGNSGAIPVSSSLAQTSHTSTFNTNYITSYNLSSGVSTSLTNLPVYITGSLFIRTGPLTVMGVAFGSTSYYDPAVTFGTNQILVYTLTMAADMASYTFNWKYVPTTVATYTSINGNAITTTGPAELEIVGQTLKLWFSKAGSTTQMNYVSIPLDFVSNASAVCTASQETLASVLYRESLSNLANTAKSEQFYPSYIGHRAIFVSATDTSASGGTIYALNSMPSSVVNGTALTTKFVIKK